MLTKTEHVLLKDNPELKPLFEWLRVNNIEGLGDVKPECHREKLINVMRSFEVKFAVKHDEVIPMMLFQNTVPLEGDFGSAITETLRIFYKMMYSPDEDYVPRVEF